MIKIEAEISFYFCLTMIIFVYPLLGAIFLKLRKNPVIMARPLIFEILLWFSSLMIIVVQMIISYYNNDLDCKIRAWIGVPIHILYFSTILLIATRLLLLYKLNTEEREPDKIKMRVYDKEDSSIFDMSPNKIDNENKIELEDPQPSAPKSNNTQIPRLMRVNSSRWQVQETIKESLTSTNNAQAIGLYIIFVTFWLVVFVTTYSLVLYFVSSQYDPCRLKILVNYSIGGIIIALLIFVITKLYSCYDEYWIKGELYSLIITGSISTGILLAVQILISDDIGQLFASFSYIIPSIIHFVIPICIAIRKEKFDYTLDIRHKSLDKIRQSKERIIEEDIPSRQGIRNSDASSSDQSEDICRRGIVPIHKQSMIDIMSTPKGLASINIFMAANQYSAFNTSYPIWRDIKIIMLEPEDIQARLFLLCQRFDWNIPPPKSTPRASVDLQDDKDVSAYPHLYRWYINTTKSWTSSSTQEIKITSNMIDELRAIVYQIENWIQAFKPQYTKSRYYMQYATLHI